MEQTSAGALEFSIQREDAQEQRFSIGLPSGSAVKKSACISGAVGSIAGSEKSPGGGHGKPLQYSHLENPMRSLVGYSPQGHKDDSFRDDWSSLACTHAEFLYMYWDMSPGASYIFCIFIQNKNTGDQWLRLHTSNTGCLGSTPGQETTSHLPQLRPGVLKYINNFLKNEWRNEWIKSYSTTEQLSFLGKFESRGIKNKTFLFFTPNSTRRAGVAKDSVIEFWAGNGNHLALFSGFFSMCRNELI